MLLVAHGPWELLRGVWPYVVSVGTGLFILYRFERVRKDDREKRDDARVVEKREEHDRQDVREQELKNSVVSLAQSIARETINTQREEILRLRSDSDTLREQMRASRMRIDELESEKRDCDAKIMQLQGEIRQLKQIMTSLKRDD